MTISKKSKDNPLRTSTRIDFPLASTWIADHYVGREPFVEIFLATGEAVIADYFVDKCKVTVIHAQPQEGYVLVG